MLSFVRLAGERAGHVSTQTVKTLLKRNKVRRSQWTAALTVPETSGYNPQ